MSDATLLSCWQPVDRTLADLQIGCQEFEQQTGQLLDELDRLRLELQEKAEQLEVERRKVALREDELADQRGENARITLQLERQEAQLAEAVAAIKEIQRSNNEIKQANNEIKQSNEEIRQASLATAPLNADDQPTRKSTPLDSGIDLTEPSVEPDEGGDSVAVSEDHVVNSVAAQFEKLQKDVAGRRKKKKPKK